MCVVSNVYDHYRPMIEPWIRPTVSPPAPPVAPADVLGPLRGLMTKTAAEELRALIAEFREAVAAAKTVDRVLGTPDCEDPEKAKLEARVAELERRLGEVEKTARPRKKANAARARKSRRVQR